ncbi:hypothetical protein, partial [Spirochaeta cellobiosiphila]|uniref:hypothetical protein n=2 Tax=Spirochaeta cellobiosiphila TaxID=504483 RepID=UPI00055F0778
MKKKSSILLFIILLIISVNSIYGQSQYDLSQNYDSSLLEVYLDKADQQQTQDDWFRLAEYGVEAVVAKWEQELTVVQGEDLDIEGEKNALEQNLNEIVEERLIKYLSKQFFLNLNGPELGSLLSTIDEQNLKYLYQTDDEG